MSVTALFGAGAMGEAVLAGLRRADPTGRVLVAEKRPERAEELAARYGVEVVDTATAAAADLLVVVVKPYDVAALLDEVGPLLRPGAVVVSLAAGLTVATLESHLPAGTALVRAMPNTPALVGEGVTAISPGTACTDADLDRADALLSAVGPVLRVPESQQDAVTAVSGSGPAYLFLVAEAMVEGGVHLGLSRETATALVAQIFVGSATMLRDSGRSATLLREQVTSPGGTTAAALRRLDDHGVRAAFLAALEAARDRSRELGA